jgi:hypothetical protein
MVLAMTMLLTGMQAGLGAVQAEGFDALAVSAATLSWTEPQRLAGTLPGAGGDLAPAALAAVLLSALIAFNLWFLRHLRRANARPAGGSSRRSGR